MVGLLTVALDLGPTLNWLSVLRTPSACSRICVRLPAEGQAIGGKTRLRFGWCGCSFNTIPGGCLPIYPLIAFGLQATSWGIWPSHS
jgi:hypothetical protein